MACSVIRNSDGTIYEVLAPNGRPSKLFRAIKSLPFVEGERAFNYYAVANKQTTKGVALDENGEPILAFLPMSGKSSLIVTDAVVYHQKFPSAYTSDTEREGVRFGFLKTKNSEVSKVSSLSDAQANAEHSENIENSTADLVVVPDQYLVAKGSNQFVELGNLVRGGESNTYEGLLENLMTKEIIDLERNVIPAPQSEPKINLFLDSLRTQGTIAKLVDTGESSLESLLEFNEIDNTTPYTGMFTTESTGISGYDEILYPAPHLNKGYHFFYKGVKASIEYMTPQEYLRRVREGNKGTEDTNITDTKQNQIKEAIDDGDLIHMPVLDYRNKGFTQEGRNRASVAFDRGEKIIPVAIFQDVSAKEKRERAGQIATNVVRQGIPVNSLDLQREGKIMVEEAINKKLTGTDSAQDTSELVRALTPVYSAKFLAQDEVERLKKLFPPVHPNVYYHHSTIEFRPKDLSNIEFGVYKPMKIIGRLTTDRVDALVVENPKSSNKYPHITLSTAEGVKPAESNKALEDNPENIEYFDKPVTVYAVEGVFSGKRDITSLTQPKKNVFGNKEPFSGEYPQEVQDAIDFAREKHKAQKRKYTGVPYHIHLEEVASKVAEFTTDPEVIRAAILHDAIEDTDTTQEEIRENFGDRVAGIVQELTDEYTKDKYPDLNRKVRKQREAGRLSGVSDAAKLIKAADKLNNIQDIAENDPKFAVKYLEEAQDDADAIRSDSPLYNTLQTKITELREWLKTIELQEPIEELRDQQIVDNLTDLEAEGSEIVNLAEDLGATNLGLGKDLWQLKNAHSRIVFKENKNPITGEVDGVEINLVETDIAFRGQQSATRLLKFFLSRTDVFGLKVVGVVKPIPDVKKISKGKEVLLTPETSENYANLTEDGQGNFVFYHVGKKGYKEIDPKRLAMTGATTEEQTARGLVGGMSFYYTKPDDGESMVNGEARYMVKVPMSEVYDFNQDPQNLLEKARQMHESSEHAALAFDFNMQLAHITKLANDLGFKMVVANWREKETRAQTTESLVPSDVEERKGDIITKPFQENYVSNEKKGWKVVPLVTNTQKLNKVYGRIAKHIGDNYEHPLYSLEQMQWYDFTDPFAPYKSQQEITEAIQGSKLPKRLKDAYYTALNFQRTGGFSTHKKMNTSQEGLIKLYTSVGFEMVGDYEMIRHPKINSPQARIDNLFDALLDSGDITRSCKL